MALSSACGGGTPASSGVFSTFRIQTAAAAFEAHTADTSPPSAAFNVYLQNVPSTGLYIQLSQPPSGFITSVTDTESTDSSGQVTVAISMALPLPATLGSGFFMSSVNFSVCYDKACQHQLAGSPATESIYYTVYLTSGYEYSLLTANIDGISDLAYDTVGQKLYVSGLSGYSNGFSGAVTQIDPLSGTAGTQTALNDSLFGMATSDDGSYVYVGSTTDPVLYRLSLPSLTPNLTIALGSSGDPCCDSEPNTVSEVTVAPGAPHTIAVSLAHPQGIYNTGGTVVYDDAVARPQILQPLGYYAQPDAIAWGASATSLIVSRSSSQLPLATDIASVTVSTSGLSIASSVSLDSAIYAFGRVFYGAGRAYDMDGHVIDVTSGAALGQFTLPADDPTVALLPDPSHGRVFVLQSSGGGEHLLLLNYDASMFALQSVIDLGFDEFDVALRTHMILWGSNGIAFNRNGVQILSGTFTTSPATAGMAQRMKRMPAPILAPRGIHIHPRAHATPGAA